MEVFDLVTFASLDKRRFSKTLIRHAPVLGPDAMSFGFESLTDLFNLKIVAKVTHH